MHKETMEPKISQALPEEREQLCLDLESVIKLYRSTAHHALFHETLTVESFLTSIRQVLCEEDEFQPLSQNDVIRVKNLLKDLRSHVNMIALKSLNSEMGEVKSRLCGVEKRISNATCYWGCSRPTVGCDLPGDNEMWHRMKTKIKDVLGPSSVSLNENHLHQKPAHEKCNKDSTEAKTHHEHGAERKRQPATVYTQTEASPEVQERINRLQHFLNEKRYRREVLSEQSLRTTSETVRKVHCLVHQSEQSRRRAEKTLINGLQKENADLNEPEAQCDKCLALMRERDLFWGLESDSETTSSSEPKEECTDTKKDIEEFLASLPRDERHRTSISVQLSPSKSLIVGQKPPGVAGRGTWATPAHVPPWTVCAVRNPKEKDQKAKVHVRRSRGTHQGFFNKLWNKF